MQDNQSKTPNDGESNSEIVEEATQDTELNTSDQIKNLEEQISELNDRFVRSQAEIQNIQKRNFDEIKKSREYAISSFAKDIIVIKDYLEMALKDDSGNFENLKMGVDLTLKQLIQVFERQSIKEIVPAIKDNLDPNLHQAMSTTEAEDFESNTIINLMQKGYSLHERILRPAMVTVAK